MVADKIGGIGEMVGFYGKVYTSARKAIDKIDKNVIEALKIPKKCEDFETYFIGGGLSSTLTAVGRAMENSQ